MRGREKRKEKKKKRRRNKVSFSEEPLIV